MAAASSPPLPRRIVVLGASGSGKSVLAERLARALEVPFVELDALFWEPGWVESSDEVFGARISAALAGDAWVVAGSYRRLATTLIWPRADRIVCLDLPLHLTLRRLMGRIWRRWRTQELLWGTNVERFWPQFKVWDPKASLVGFSISTHRSRRQQYLELIQDRTYAGRALRLTTPRQVEAFAQQIEAGARTR